jgi:aspartate 1-decarboxylase
MIKVIRAKLHGIRVTSADLDYHGSITLDPEHCEAAGIYPLEFVDIWNKNSGARISTYVVFGDRGSRCCILNGAAARTCQIGDQLIIAASEYIDRMALGDFDPVVLTFHSDNSIDKQLLYCVRPAAALKHSFSIEPRPRAPGHNGGGASAPDSLRDDNRASTNLDPSASRL